MREAAVVVVTYNSDTYIGACLRSLLQHADGTYDIFVWDNGSTDRSVDIARSFEGVGVLGDGDNHGFGEALNRAFAALHHPLLASVNPDCIVRAGWFAPLAAALENPRVGAVTPRLGLANSSTINACGNRVHISGLTTCRLLGEDVESSKALLSQDVTAISGAAFAIRRETWNAVGGMWAPFFLYLEDTELSLRLAAFGYTVRYVAESVVEHAYRPRFGPQKLELLERNRQLMLRATLDEPALRALRPALLLVNLLGWIYAVSQGWSGVLARIRAGSGYRKLRSRAMDRRASLPAQTDARILALLDDVFDLGQLGPLSQPITFVTRPLFFVIKARALQRLSSL